MMKKALADPWLKDLSALLLEVIAPHQLTKSMDEAIGVWSHSLPKSLLEQEIRKSIAISLRFACGPLPPLPEIPRGSLFNRAEAGPWDRAYACVPTRGLAWEWPFACQKLFYMIPVHPEQEMDRAKRMQIL